MASAADRLDAALARIAAENERLQIVTALDEPGARHAAEAADMRAKAGASLGPLDGMLIAVKDNIAVKGLPRTAGLDGWRGRIAETDAAVSARLRAAGAVILGMLNMHEGAFGATTDNPAFGRTCNPLDPGRTPGGSSGGSGAAVAARFVEAALGTDTMGSVRIPAAYCGVCGLKPTEDAVDDLGLIHLSPAFDTIGPLAKDPACLADVFEAIRDPLSRRHTDLPPLEAMRLGVPTQIAEVDLEPQVAEAFDRARAVFERLGATLVDLDLAGWSPGRARRGGLLIVEAEGAVALSELRAQQVGMSDALRGLLDYGAALSSDRLVDAMARVRGARRAARRALTSVDALLIPTAPQRAFPHEAPIPDNQADLTALANFAGLPATSLPVACPDGLPAAVQIVGPDWSERALCTLAGAAHPALLES